MKRQVILAVFLVGIYLVACTPPATTRQLELTSPVPTTVPLPTATNRWPSRHTPQPSSGSGGHVSCTESVYKTEAKKHMQRISDLTDRVSLDSDADAMNARRQFEAVLKDIRGMKCAEAYPFKQETLEYTAIHAIRAIDSFLDGDLAGMNDSFDSAILNAQWFNDWSVDMD